MQSQVHPPCLGLFASYCPCADMPLAQGISCKVQALAVWQWVPTKSVPVQSHVHVPSATDPVGTPLTQAAVSWCVVHGTVFWHRFPSYPVAQLHVQLPVCPFAAPPFMQAMASEFPAPSSEQSLGSWQVFPSHPAAHVHVKESTPSAHDPPFWQGSDAQSLISFSHRSPSYPAGQLHAHGEASLGSMVPVTVPPFRHESPFWLTVHSGGGGTHLPYSFVTIQIPNPISLQNSSLFETVTSLM